MCITRQSQLSTWVGTLVSFKVCHLIRRGGVVRCFLIIYTNSSTHEERFRPVIVFGLLSVSFAFVALGSLQFSLSLLIYLICVLRYASDTAEVLQCQPICWETTWLSSGDTKATWGISVNLMFRPDVRSLPGQYTASLCFCTSTTKYCYGFIYLIHSIYVFYCSHLQNADQRSAEISSHIYLQESYAYCKT